MKIRILCWIVGLAVVVVWPVGALAEIKLTVAEIYPENSPTTRGLLKFAELVKERSNGEIVIEVKFGGVLGKGEKAVIEQVQLGALDMGRISIAPLTKFVPELEMFYLPYLWKSQESLWNVLKGGTGQRLLKEMELAKFYGLCYYEAGARSFYNSKREIKTVDDLKGLKIQVPKSDLMRDFVNTLGATAVPMAFSEVYEAIRNEVIDGAEDDWPSYESSGHYEVAKYYTLDRHTRVPEILVASKILFDKKLKPDQIALIKQAAQETQAFVIQKWNEREETSQKIIMGKGNVITELTPEAQEEFIKAVRPLYTKYGAKYKALLEEIRAQQ